MHLLSVVQPGYFTPVVFCWLMIAAHTGAAQRPIHQVPIPASLPTPSVVAVDSVQNVVADSVEGSTLSTTTAVATPPAVVGPVARPVHSFARLVPPPPPADDAGYCEASLGQRLGTGFVVGAVLGLVAYSTVAALTPDGELKKRRRKLAAPLIIGTGVIMAVHEVQFPSRLSCP